MNAFRRGMKDGIPIGLGYFAVAFSLGIAARNAGLNPAQGFFASILNIASAGEYALFSLIAAGATFVETAIMTFVVNARYILMSCAMSQRFHPRTNLLNRIGVGAFITDELFAIAVARPGYLEPSYTYGAALTSVLPWGFGTMFGVFAGNVLPVMLVSALSVAIYGMFLAIIIPPAKKSRVIALFVLISFAVSYVCTVLPGIKDISYGTRSIILTVVLASAAALIAPVPDEKAEDGSAEDPEKQRKAVSAAGGSAGIESDLRKEQKEQAEQKEQKEQAEQEEQEEQKEQIEQKEQAEREDGDE